MLAAVTTGPHRIEVRELPAPPPPRPGWVALRPETVGVCGSDAHIFHGQLAALSGADRSYPRVQGHEISAVIDRIGDGCPARLRVGERVAVWPVSACCDCYPCRTGRPNVCVNFQLVGVHRDGGLAERMSVPAGQVFPTGGLAAEATAIVEPVSIAVHAVRRARLAGGEQVAVLGAGPIGQSVCLAARDAGASVLVIDPVQRRREIALRMGAQQALWDERPVDAAREWAREDGPEVVIDTTGRPEVLADAMDMAVAGGTVVVVGMTADEAPVRSGVLPVKELDVLGSSCCTADGFAAAVDLVTRHPEAAEGLVTHTVPLHRVADAFALTEPGSASSSAALKVLVSIPDSRS